VLDGGSGWADRRAHGHRRRFPRRRRGTSRAAPRRLPRRRRAGTGSAGTLDAALVDGRRINVFERWVTEEDLPRFRGSGPSDDQDQQLEGADVQELRLEEGAGRPAG
jgi:hypothetical protein